MYLWNAKGLAVELKEGTLSEWDKFKYYLLEVSLASILYEVLAYDGLELTFLNVFSSVSGVIIFIFGTYYCYLANKQGDGISFIERFICLGIPVTIRLSVLYAVLGILIEILVFILYRYDVPDSSLDILSDSLWMALSWIIYVAIYYKLYTYLKFVSGATVGNTISEGSNE